MVAAAALAGLYYTYIAAGAEPLRWRVAGPAFTVQVLCYVVVWLLLGWQRSWALPRASDAGVLVLLWAGVYLVYPTGVWLRGGYDLGPMLAGYVPVVFQAHSVFLVAFMAAFLAIGGHRSWEPPEPDMRYLPSGRLLAAVPLAFLAALAVARIAGSGTLLPGSDYGGAWLDLQSQIASARTSGGLEYLATQILGKGYFFAILALGVGCGLALARAFQFRRGRFRLLGAILAGVVLSLFMGVTTRSGALMVLVTAVILADMLTGLVRWRYILIAFGLGFVVFVFFGYFRNLSSLGLERGVALSYQQFSRPSTQGDVAVREFLLMLEKDAVGARMFEGHADGMSVVLNSALSPIPSQLLPGKLEWLPTASLLSLEMLGTTAVRGAGVAGSAIADGFRIGGLLGVGFSAGLLGALLGAVNRWLTSLGGARGRPQLLKVALAAGFFAYAFGFVRGDFALMLNVLVYAVIVPWVFLHLALSGRTRRAWLGVMPDGPEGLRVASASARVGSPGSPPRLPTA